MDKEANIELEEKCRWLARKAHIGQTRRDGSDYINHPIEVGEWCKARGYCGVVVGVAYVHDVKEDNLKIWLDQKYQIRFITNKTTYDTLIHAVDLLTHDRDISYDDYIGKLLIDNSAAGYVARIVKVADILANLNDSPSARQLEKYPKSLKKILEVVLRTDCV